MQTLRRAAELLHAANSPDGRLAVARELGFRGEALTLDAVARERLRPPITVRAATLVAGVGALRALLIDSTEVESLRQLLTSLAAPLGSRSAHVLWTVIASSASGDEIGIACWQPGARGSRTVALVAQRARIVASDAESLCALAAATDVDDLAVYTRWCELLGCGALSRKFYRILESRVRTLAESLTGVPASERSELALLCVSRLLFLSFLEAKEWLNGDRAFLSASFDGCMAGGGRFHQRVLLPLFFGTLNTRMSRRAPEARRLGAIPFLNGGLFSRAPIERRNARARFSDEAIGQVFGDLLGAFRFTARENQEHWGEASIDPEMLGRAFESLMAARERRTSGAFYTPQELVARVTRRALVVALGDDTLAESSVEAALGGDELSPKDAETLCARLKHFAVLDPACGSGAFLVHVLERVADLRKAAGDSRNISAIRREVLARTIYGVDVNPTAVWLCELRLWLSVVIESTEERMSAVPALPNLDGNIRVGDALSGAAFFEPPALMGPSATLVRLHERYVRATGPRKAPLRRALAREERRRAVATIDRELTAISSVRRERLVVRRAADLFGERAVPGRDERMEMRSQRLRAAALRRERRRLADGGAVPFSFPSHFGAAHARGGFDLVIGNPPWVRLHNITPTARAGLRARFVTYREAGWELGSRAGHAARGFSSQVDLAALFVERSTQLASTHGCIALLVPAKLWRSLAGGGVRRLVTQDLTLRTLEDWSEAPSTFDAAVYPSALVASRSSDRRDAVIGVHRRTMELQWSASARDLRYLRHDAASPLLLLPPDARRVFDRLAGCGPALGDSRFRRAILGVKCGCNDAFIVDAVEVRGALVTIEREGRHGDIERELLRPLLRGDHVTPWQIQRGRHAIIWTHDDFDEPLRALPPGAAHWLAPWRRRLLDRTDLRGTRAWWALFRTESADSSKTRVVWNDFGRTPRAALLPRGDRTVPLNSCYVVQCDDESDALALTALLNSAVAAAWLNAIAG